MPISVKVRIGRERAGTVREGGLDEGKPPRPWGYPPAEGEGASMDGWPRARTTTAYGPGDVGHADRSAVSNGHPRRRARKDELDRGHGERPATRRGSKSAAQRMRWAAGFLVFTGG